MKRCFALLLTLVMLLSLCACAEKKPGADPAGSGPDATPAGDETKPTETAPDTAETEPTATDAEPEATEPEPTATEPAPPESSEENAGGFTAEYERAYDMIQETYAADGSYTDDYGNSCTYYYHLPNLIPTTPGANSINEKLADRFSEEITNSLAAISEGQDTVLRDVSWFLFIYDGVINLVVDEHIDWGDANYYEVYYYDMNTGAELTPQQMLARITLTEEDFLDGAREACVRQYESQFGNLTAEQKETAGYDTMLAYQKSDELINFEMLKLFVDDGGNVGVYAPIASLAGAAYYYQLLYPSFNMG